MKIVDLEQGTPEWHTWRLQGVGSSDISKIVGISPFGDASNVYKEKMGFFTTKETPAMRRGKQYEPRALELFNGNRYNLAPICIEKESKPFMRASLDGWDGISMMCEIKVPGEKDMALARDGIVPDYYETQMQWQMDIAACMMGWYVCYDIDTDQIIEIPVQRDQKKIEALQLAATKFWENFLNGIAPPAKKEYDIIDDSKYLRAVSKWLQIKTNRETEDPIFTELKEEILSFNQGRSFKGGGITVSQTEPRATYDHKAMAKDGIDINKYMKMGEPSWRITVDK